VNFEKGTMKQVLAFVMAAAIARGVMADGVEQGVAETLKLLGDRGIAVDAAAAQRSVTLALARTADPGAEVVAEGLAKHRQEEMSGLDYSAGFRLSVSNGLPLVIAVDADSPAAKAGLAKGDVITAIGETNAFDLITLPDAVRATRAHAADKIALLYRRSPIATNSASLTLALLKLPAIECSETLPNGIFYVKVNGLFAGGGTAIADALRGWTAKSRSGVLLDLRGAGGDDSDSVKSVASLFAKNDDVLYSLRDRRDHELQIAKAAGEKPLGVPVLVLIDHDTRGASELLAAVLGDSVKGAMIVGRFSRGDPLVREYVKLTSGDLLYLATKQIVTADGTRYDGRTGVKPDVQAGGTAVQPEYDAEPIADRRQLLEQELQDFALRNRIRGDAALRRAVDILLGLKALNIGAQGSTGSAN
jgi:carboxyl-terminal processing protease